MKVHALFMKGNRQIKTVIILILLRTHMWKYMHSSWRETVRCWQQIKQIETIIRLQLWCSFLFKKCFLLIYIGTWLVRYNILLSALIIRDHFAVSQRGNNFKNTAYFISTSSTSLPLVKLMFSKGSEPRNITPYQTVGQRGLYFVAQ